MPEVIENTQREGYRADLERIQLLDAPAWLSELRENAAKRFAELDFPNRRSELWSSTNISPIVKTPFRLADKPGEVTAETLAPYLYDDAAWNQLVFIDGVYDAGLSRIAEASDGLVVGSLRAAIDAEDSFVREQLDKAVDQSTAFIALNSASLQDGALVRVRKNTSLAHPIHVLHVATGQPDTVTHPRNLVVLEESSEATLIETYASLSDSTKYFTNVVSEIILEANARLERYTIVEEGDDAFHLSTDCLVLGRDTYLNNFVMTLSGQIVRNELVVQMNGEGCECSLNGLYLCDRDRVIDNALNVTHAQSRCRSRMAYKGVLDDTSTAVFTGKVFVEPDAQQTDSDQLNNNLLLSDKATIDTRPQLEIFADDVKCTHGATIGSFPDELIFYFRSRGISAEQAHNILTCGFAEEVVDKISIDPLRERLARYVFQKYNVE